MLQTFHRIVVKPGGGSALSLASETMTLRFEGSFNPLDDGTEVGQHFFDDLIIPYPEAAILQDLGRQVPVAKMPGKANEMFVIPAFDLENLLRSSDNAQPSTIMFEGKTIAFVKWLRFRQIEQHTFTGTGCQPEPPTVPVIISKRYRVDIAVIGPFPGLCHHYQPSHTHLEKKRHGKPCQDHLILVCNG